MKCTYFEQKWTGKVTNSPQSTKKTSCRCSWPGCDWTQKVNTAAYNAAILRKHAHVFSPMYPQPCTQKSTNLQKVRKSRRRKSVIISVCGEKCENSCVFYACTKNIYTQLLDMPWMLQVVKKLIWFSFEQLYARQATTFVLLKQAV